MHFDLQFDLPLLRIFSALHEGERESLLLLTHYIDTVIINQVQAHK